MLTRKSISFVLLFSLLAISSFGANRNVVLHVQAAEVSWADSDLEELIITRFTRDREFRLTMRADNSAQPEFPSAKYDIDSLLNWGNEIGGRYLLVVNVNSERLENKRTFHIPLILHRFEAIGVIDAEIRLLDLERGRMLMAEQISVELSAKRIIQADTDKNINDADIHIAASKKGKFLAKLEKKFADHLYAKVKRSFRNR